MISSIFDVTSSSSFELTFSLLELIFELTFYLFELAYPLVLNGSLLSLPPPHHLFDLTLSSVILWAYLWAYYLLAFLDYFERAAYLLDFEKFASSWRWALLLDFDYLY
jgi:hypothetical protein